VQGSVLIDAQVASQRVLFEQFMAKGQQCMATQEKLFPKVMEFNASDFSVLEEIYPICKKWDSMPHLSVSKPLHSMAFG
jgi:DNA mismatch repair ATPase MutL